MSSIVHATECDGHLVMDRQGTVDETSLVRSFLHGVRMNPPGKST